MKILIAVPCMDQVPALFAQSLATLNRVGNCKIAFQIGSLIYHSRDNLAKKAIEEECDYIFWLDSDMVFQPDTLERLIQSIGKGDIISGLYFRRVSPFSPVLFKDFEVVGESATWSDFHKIPKDVFEVGACGFGCLIMPTNIFIDVQVKFGQMFAPIGRIGEDLSFCWRARQCGYKIVCDPTIELGHIGHHIINREFYDVYTKK